MYRNYLQNRDLLVFKYIYLFNLDLFSYLFRLQHVNLQNNYLKMWDTYTVTKIQNIVQLLGCCIYLSLKSNIQIILELLVIRGKRLSPYLNFEFSLNFPKASNDQIFKFSLMLSNTFLRSQVSNFLRYILYFKIYTFDSASNFQM